jgi:N-methylhydantoinase A
VLGIDADVDAACRAIDRHIGERLDLPLEAAADAVIRVVTEQMVHAVEEVTVEQGLDPRDAVLVSGGGAAGFNIVSIAARLGCRRLVVPGTSTALSATGGLMSEIVAERAVALYVRSNDFDAERVNRALEDLVALCNEWIAATGLQAEDAEIEILAEARYPGQVWELELPVQTRHFSGADSVERLREDFHRHHEAMFAVCDPDSPVEVVGWRARVRSPSGGADEPQLASGFESDEQSSRRIYLGGQGWLEAPVVGSAAIGGIPGPAALGGVEGPAVLELPGTSILLQADTVATRSPAGAILVTLPELHPRAAAPEVLNVH